VYDDQSASGDPNFLIGTVTSYSGTILTIAITYKKGINQSNDWTINLSGDVGPSGPQGPEGATGASGPQGSTGPTGSVPNEISFRAHQNGSNSAPTQSIPTSTNTIVQFNNVDFNIGNAFSTTNYRFIPTAVGRYFLSASIKFDDLAPNNQFKIAIQKNGTEVVAEVNVTFSGLSDPRIETSTLVQVAVGDYFEVVAWHDDSAGNRNIYGPPAESSFEGFKI
jgi:hypothetical protein